MFIEGEWLEVMQKKIKLIKKDYLTKYLEFLKQGYYFMVLALVLCRKIDRPKTKMWMLYQYNQIYLTLFAKTLSSVQSS